MISDDKLRAFVDITASDVEKDEFASSSIRHTFLHALCKELLAYREAERKTKSWDDTEAWVQTRRKVTEFYDNTGQLRGKFYGEPEKRPK